MTSRGPWKFWGNKQPGTPDDSAAEPQSRIPAPELPPFGPAPARGRGELPVFFRLEVGGAVALEEVIASQKRRIAELEAMFQAKEPPERGEARRQDNVIHVQFRR